MIKKIHYFSGVTIALFVGVHLVNHLLLFKGDQAHINFMNTARLVYRNPFVESVLMVAVILQIISGIRLVKNKWKDKYDHFDYLQIYSGLFLSYFLLAHVSVVLFGRMVLNLDTNLYFGAAVLNNYPAYFYFIFHYGLAVIAFFTHIACIHKIKMTTLTTPRCAQIHAYVIIAIGIVVSVLIVYRMMQVTIPPAYHFLPFGKY